LNLSTWRITGSSSGLGYALAEYALQQGDQVVLAACNVAAMEQLAARHPTTALAVALDVTDPDQRADVVRQAEAHFGAPAFTCRMG